MKTPSHVDLHISASGVSAEAGWVYGHVAPGQSSSQTGRQSLLEKKLVKGH